MFSVCPQGGGGTYSRVPTPLSRSGWGGGLPPVQVRMGVGVPQGTSPWPRYLPLPWPRYLPPPPDRTAHGILNTLQSVCFLHSGRRTFLLNDYSTNSATTLRCVFEKNRNSWFAVTQRTQNAFRWHNWNCLSKRTCIICNYVELILFFITAKWDLEVGQWEL